MNLGSSTKVIQSRRVMLRDRMEPAAIVIEQGRIAEVASYGQPAAIDLGEAVIMPGLVDPHVHLNEPGRTAWEGFATGTAAAAAGGITTVVDMPLNSSPVTTSLAALTEKRRATMAKLSINVGFHGGLVPGNLDQLEPMIDAGVMGIKAFMCPSGIDDFPQVCERELREAMPLLAARGVPLLVHAEIESPTPAMASPRRYADYLQTRPPSFEHEAIAMLIGLCGETGCHVHIVHLADAGSVPMLSTARASGLPITVETCPHYLVFAAEEIADGQTMFKCAPPIRSAHNRELLWDALRDGVIDMIASDHSPCPPAMKSLAAGRFDQAWGGISSLQLGLSAIWAEAERRGFSLMDVSRWMNYQPAKLLGLSRSIASQESADFIVFDDTLRWTVEGTHLQHRHKVTPYDGRSVRGLVLQTFVNGQIAAPGLGRTINRRDKQSVL